MGKGTPLRVATIPFKRTGFWFSPVSIGPVSLPVPKSLPQIPAGELTENDLGNPNKNILMSNSGAFLTPATALVAMISDQEQTYFVRIVPITKNGTAGTPTIPETVVIRRPHPCQENSPGTVKTDLVIKTPTDEIELFYMTLLLPDWIRTDQNGALVSRAQFVTVTSPPYCGAAATGNSMIDSTNTQFCNMYGGCESGYHFKAGPAESHWYDTVWDIIKGMFMARITVTKRSLQPGQR
ncbi:MAG: hypothetical protein WCF90_02580 [Methanomicrobiales archaeon]